MRTVFISYSHDSPEHSERVRALSASLSRDGCECQVDVYKDTDEDWPTWMTRQLLEADFILCVTTETYERRFRDRELPDVGLGAGWEAALIRRLLYAKKLHNDRIFPVMFDGSDRRHIPLELQGYNFFQLDGDKGYESLLRKVLKLPLHVAPTIGTPPILGATPTAPLFARPGGLSASAAHGSKPDTRADISRILKYAPAELIGRDVELKLLNDAWTKVQNSTTPRPRVLTFVALGGEGKTALVAKWAAELAAQDWPGCHAVFAWSFYSQGTREQQATSSDLFLKEALTFFGDDADKAFAASPAGAFEKGQRLARLVGQRRSLLILDGLEPLQYAPTAPTPGELKDQGLAALLRGLAAASHGLCLVTTRYSLPDLRAFWQTTAPEVKLLRLSRDAGVHLLKTLGVTGTAQEFATLVEDVKGHALTLTLLGGFLKRAFHGDIRQRDRVKFEKADEKMDGGHAFRTLAAYEQWLLRDGGAEGRREVAVLRLMGLFDRPADAGCLHALLQPPAIPGLTEPLVGLAEDDWEFCLTGLESAKLLTVNYDESGALVSLDGHPHLRAYFAKQLGEKNPEAWRAGHKRLYEHLCMHKEGDQPTLENLQPLYQAIAHGCESGVHQDGYASVFCARILRGKEFYSAMRLGAIQSDLAALAGFFVRPWNADSLRDMPCLEQALLLKNAGYCLRANGRLSDARSVLKSSQAKFRECGHIHEAIATLGILCSVDIILGKLNSAAKTADAELQLALTTNFLWAHLTARSRIAEVDSYKGDYVCCESLYKEAFRPFGCDGGLSEELCRYFETLGDYDAQTSIIGSLVRYVEFLVLSGQFDSAKVWSERVGQLIKGKGHESRSGYYLGFLNVYLGQAHLGYALGRTTAPSGKDAEIEKSLQRSRNCLEDALRIFRDRARENEIPRALIPLAKVQLFRGRDYSTHDFVLAQTYLDEAWAISKRGSMKLFLADICLQRATLFYRAKEYPAKWVSPRADLNVARSLIEECGYWRRREELEDAENAIGI